MQFLSFNPSYSILAHFPLNHSFRPQCVVDAPNRLLECTTGLECRSLPPAPLTRSPATLLCSRSAPLGLYPAPTMATKSRGPVNAAHTAGIFADSSFDGPEIGTLVAVVDRAKNLPNRKTMGKQDPYCAMRLGKEAKKTETDRRGGQTPRW